jgi:hypothetical protein
MKKQSKLLYRLIRRVADAVAILLVAVVVLFATRGL